MSLPLLLLSADTIVSVIYWDSGWVQGLDADTCGDTCQGHSFSPAMHYPPDLSEAEAPPQK